MLFAQDIWSPIVQGGALGLCVIMLGVLFWIIKKLFTMLKNDIGHLDKHVKDLKNTVNTLPCQTNKCPNPTED